MDYCNFKDIFALICDATSAKSMQIIFVGLFLFAALNSCANVTMTKNQDTRRGCEWQRRWYTIPPTTCLSSNLLKVMFVDKQNVRQITNADGIFHTPTCCKCEQEISPNVNSRLGVRIWILRIRICTGGPIRATGLRCTLVDNLYMYIMGLWFCQKGLLLLLHVEIIK